jgi:hypothetical protein
MNAAIRMTDTLLRSVGGRQVLLRIPQPAVNGDLGEELGVTVPSFRDVPLAPVVFRRVRAKTGTAEHPASTEYELLVSALAVRTLVGSLQYEAAEVLFAQAAAVVVDESLMTITWVTSAETFGGAYLYRIGLRGTVQEIL